MFFSICTYSLEYSVFYSGKVCVNGGLWNDQISIFLNVRYWYYCIEYTVKPVHAVTCLKRSHFSCPVIEHFIWNWTSFKRSSVLKYHFFSFSQRWSLNTGLTTYFFVWYYFSENKYSTKFIYNYSLKSHNVQKYPCNYKYTMQMFHCTLF